MSTEDRDVLTELLDVTVMSPCHAGDVGSDMVLVESGDLVMVC